MNRVVVNLGNFKLDEIPLDRGSLNIGRASDNDISLADPATSAHHAKIVTIFTSSFIQDLNSTNGTIVNGRKVVRHTLHHGDIISIGNLQLLYKSDEGVTTDKNKKTISIDKKEFDEMMSKSSGQPMSPVTKPQPSSGTARPAGNQLSGFSITVPKADDKDVKNTDEVKEDEVSIPTLDETLPLDELRKNPSRTVVVDQGGDLPDFSESKEEQPEEQEETHQEPEEEMHEIEEILIKGTDEFEDTMLTLSNNVDEQYDEKSMHAALLNEDDGKSRAMAKIIIMISILTVIIVSLLLLL